jgi:hypothetical protein
VSECSKKLTIRMKYKPLCGDFDSLSYGDINIIIQKKGYWAERKKLSEKLLKSCAF